MNKKILGKEGEAMAEKFLKNMGYSILAKNYLKRSGEIDLIVMTPNEDEFVFVEVKTRRSKRFGYPEESVNQKKLEKIEKTAQLWLEENDLLDNLWRIDIMAIEIDSKTKITHLKNVSLQ